MKPAWQTQTTHTRTQWELYSTGSRWVDTGSYWVDRGSFFVGFFCFSTGLVQLYIDGLPLRSCQTIGAPSVQGSAQCPFFVSGSSRIRTHVLVITMRTCCLCATLGRLGVKLGLQDFLNTNMLVSPTQYRRVGCLNQCEARTRMGLRCSGI